MIHPYQHILYIFLYQTVSASSPISFSKIYGPWCSFNLSRLEYININSFFILFTLDLQCIIEKKKNQISHKIKGNTKTGIFSWSIKPNRNNLYQYVNHIHHQLTINFFENKNHYILFTDAFWKGWELVLEDEKLDLFHGKEGIWNLYELKQRF